MFNLKFKGTCYFWQNGNHLLLLLMRFPGGNNRVKSRKSSGSLGHVALPTE